MNPAQTHFITICLRWLSAGLMLIASFSLQAGVQGSRHDLGTGGQAQNVGGTDEVCVFCHTPHGSDTAAAVPLWNKVLPAAAGYTATRYSTLNTSSLDGAEVPVGSVSLACLSCHDGAQGMDVVINAPGSTAFDPALYNAAGIALNGDIAMNGAPVPMLGTDLTNDHPISIQYAGGGCVGGDADGADACDSGIFADIDFNPADKATINSNPVWWVDQGANNGTREKTDMHLYTRTDTVAAGEPSVECGSCHDPHNDATESLVAPKSVAFLRVANAASVICTTCHIK